MVNDENNKYHQGFEIYNSPIGLLKIEYNYEKSNGYITAIKLVNKNIKGSISSPVSQLAIKQLKEYFEGKRKAFTVPLMLKGTSFQQQVWNELTKIPYGETRSYGDIATMIGNPKAARAVGMANNKNPIMIVIPCHRVIGANGTLVGYAGGLEIKSKLLSLEKEIIEK